MGSTYSQSQQLPHDCYKRLRIHGDTQMYRLTLKTPPRSDQDTFPPDIHRCTVCDEEHIETGQCKYLYYYNRRLMTEKDPVLE